MLYFRIETLSNKNLQENGREPAEISKREAECLGIVKFDTENGSCGVKTSRARNIRNNQHIVHYNEEK